VNAYEELSTTGEVGGTVLAQLYRTVGAIARRRGFPPPPGHHNWSDDAAMEEAHEFLSGRRGTGRVIQLFVKATDQQSFDKLLHRAVLNHFRSRARKSLLGPLIRRLNEVLEDDDRFERLTGGLWKLANVDPPADVVRESDLEAATWSVDVEIIRWRPDARHQSVGANAADLRKLAAGVLRTAGVPLDEGELGRIIGLRLGLHELPATISIDSTDIVDDTAPASDDRSDPSVIAAEIWGELNFHEREVLSLFDRTSQEVGDELGMSKSSAHRAMKRVETALKAKFVDVGDSSDDTWNELVDLSVAHREKYRRNLEPGGTA
jgi:hypothetical protein